MDEYTSRLLAQSSVYAALLPLLVALLKWRDLSPNQKLIRKLVIIAVLTEFFAFLVGKVWSMNNLFISHVFTVIEFIILSLIYKRELSSMLTVRFFNTIILLFVSFAIVNAICLDTIYQFNGFTRAFSSLMIIFFVLVYFYKLLKEVKIKKLESEPMFWLSIGLLIYFSASLFIFIFGNYIQPSVKLSFTFWGIHAILNITLYLIYVIALWIKPPKIA